ncbi:LysR family transcriptional regulator [Methylobrevis pamukkalensis]|uniref:HTH-type transcriptional regulator CynR n=1 Tax=Methylobrevis pamukkalensis TaxID=1439726 RepID=A0A1E3H067_9HYPH|nr:LysR family transcriptional regulator [Methylobrevis pamukkalensis]ODN69682.1 HTH-type transcriptional regulator CynR [Methylobrevis pamukkalensis]
MDERIRHLLSPSLRYFAAVARYGSFRGAARELNIASSAVNRQILSLEEALGVTLFERVGRGIRLSPAGELLLGHTAAVLREMEGLATGLDALRGLGTGRVRIASVESVGEAILPGIVTRFSAAWPGIDVHVTVAVSDEVERLVLAGEADVGLTFNPRMEASLAIGFRRNLRIGAVVAPGHPLAALRRVGLAECLRYPLALPARGLSLRHALDSTSAMRGGDIRTPVEADTLGVMKAMARGGTLVAFQTLVGLEQDLAAGTLVFRPLADADLPVDQFAVISRAEGTLTLAPTTFHAFAVNELSRLLSGYDAEAASDRP